MMTYEIDGENFGIIDGFPNEISRVLIPGATWGRNLDAFNDILWGSFGTPDEGFVLVWKNHDLSRERLGTRLRHVSWRSSARFASLSPYARRMRARRAFASERLPALGTEPNRTLRRSARPANRTFHETTRFAAGTEGR
jgi:RNAse (barnase) inhibitor barstar